MYGDFDSHDAIGSTIGSNASNGMITLKIFLSAEIEFSIHSHFYLNFARFISTSVQSVSFSCNLELEAMIKLLVFLVVEHDKSRGGNW